MLEFKYKGDQIIASDSEFLLNGKAMKEIVSEDADTTIPVADQILDKKKQAIMEIFSREFYNLGFLCGAGTSISSGGKSVHELATEIEKESDNVLSKIKETTQFQNEITQLELLISHLDDYMRLNGNKKSELKSLKTSLLRKIKEKCNLTLDSNSPHQNLIVKVTTRKPSLPRVKIYTTNYDLLFEQAAENTSTVLIDGFSFGAKRTLNSKYFDLDISVRESGKYSPEIEYHPRVLQLVKLHGSLNWSMLQDGRIVQESDVEDPLIIYPSHSKYQSSYQNPYFDMISKMILEVRKSNHLLVIVGYSFNDDHINSIITQSASQNPGIVILVINPTIPYSKPEGALSSLLGLPNVHAVALKFEDFVEYLPYNQAYSHEQFSVF